MDFGALGNGKTLSRLVQIDEGSGTLRSFQPVRNNFCFGLQFRGKLRKTSGSAIRLDIADTFLFEKIHRPGTRDYHCARYTIEVLRLNDREYLRVAREVVYELCCGILHRYVSAKKACQPPSALNRKVIALERTPHRTVWAEMKRWEDAIPELNQLFAAAPEALQQ
jgi:hypothetical protein